MSIEYLRQFRILNFAIFDFVASYIGMLLFAPLLSRIAKKAGLNLTLSHWLWLTLPLSVVFHLAFSRMTPFTQAVVGTSGGYLEKLIIIGMLYMGLKDIKSKPIKR
jgi:hypothetical protein